MGGAVFRIEPDRLGEIGDGAVKLTFVAPGQAATVVGPCVCRIEPNCLVEVGEGAVKLGLGAPVRATHVVESRKVSSA